MANFNLRGAILENVSGSNQEEVEATIVDAIQSGEEKMLPGLGVLMEVFWKTASEEEKNAITDRIASGLK
ncbi:small acid-soluble spore protein SspI [Salipaludibacillus agaradhaerens]|jgi:small acid-soluble spore protein I (minor)|uniref:Small, acid-soluble spore protein I n=1 Tax=Salipaludibacillus agaradhaerens TaxID=76935 RepID=A0A9Q4B048_SALAG|nr:small acid-soluble spore protein SspI [Salipaludibacillus agaradhaerens]UJW58585.1 small acid-soluble spore protein SspI [Bacillus sp. A116_S68]MCR6095575.1 small acid-soluble spore protein SspI [Salipaludibacillus agaradhaerens]MCR6107538.1 small acid-soluble spore protein SspI [Salipaludibacillus agaradhaerens]MCR6114865.1 small acid-soluble spore protein SspI [Salipaludibacillus agaradhaerens]MCR6119567.1 small acid-soluble spore protein SspI [Salipaludibacillus agaradhaerens]